MPHPDLRPEFRLSNWGEGEPCASRERALCACRMPAAWALLWGALSPTKGVVPLPGIHPPTIRPSLIGPPLPLTDHPPSHHCPHCESGRAQLDQSLPLSRGSRFPFVCSLSLSLYCSFLCVVALLSSYLDSVWVSLALCWYESLPLSCPLFPSLSLFSQFAFGCFSVGIWLPVSNCRILSDTKFFSCRLLHIFTMSVLGSFGIGMFPPILHCHSRFLCSSAPQVSLSEPWPVSGSLSDSGPFLPIAPPFSFTFFVLASPSFLLLIFGVSAIVLSVCGFLSSLFFYVALILKYFFFLFPFVSISLPRALFSVSFSGAHFSS